MISFKEYLLDEDITEQEIDELIESLEWEDVIELFDTEDMIIEDLSATQRIKMGQKLKSRKTMMAMARRVKLRRPADMKRLKGRTVVAARKILIKKFLKKRNKHSLSAGEKNRLEARVSAVLAVAKNLPVKLLPKVKEIERKRLKDKV